MTLYSAAFNLAHVNASGPLGPIGTLTVDNGVDTAIVLDLATLEYNHVGVVTNGEGLTDPGGTSQTFWHHAALTNFIYTRGAEPRNPARFMYHSRATFALAVQTALNTLATAESWAFSPAVIFSATTARYTFQMSSGAITLAWSTAAGAALFGFVHATTSSAASHVGTRTPTYCVLSSMPLATPKVSDPSPTYEPAEVANLAIGDDGRGYGISRFASPIFQDWKQEFESKPRTFREYATTTDPWTFEHLFEHCRTLYPFYVSLGGFESGELSYQPRVFMFRKEGAFRDWKDSRASIANDRYFHVPFRCKLEGKIQELVIPS